MEKLRPIMLGGTGSDVGKSIISTGLCRIFLQDGYTPAPFKAQNMALNSAVTRDGKEIGRAQAVQAEACGIDVNADMNPILLKPSSNHTSQVIVEGKPIGNKNAIEFYKKENRDFFRTVVRNSFDRLKRKYNPIVMEGAGSIAEINLRDSDIVNMSMAKYADAAVILVADIDRGGVFAAVYGSIMLQSPEDRKRIKGIIINKFRGEIKLFDRGRQMLEDICGIPVLGVIPYLNDICIEDEDSVALSVKKTIKEEGKINIAVVLLKHISNFTDFSPLESITDINLFYTTSKDDIENSDIVIIPGSKSTISDIEYLKEIGLDVAIKNADKQGKKIWGICGGYQILGEVIEDPEQIEGKSKKISGLGILPVKTIITDKKKTINVKFKLPDRDEICSGYEIHMGETIVKDGFKPFCVLSNTIDGCIKDNGRVVGTYMHGLFENASVINLLLDGFNIKVTADFVKNKNKRYDALASNLRRHINMDVLYKIMTSDD